MDVINNVSAGELTWFPRLGYGYVNPDLSPVMYDKGYFEEYEKRDASNTSGPLCVARRELVERFCCAEGMDDQGEVVVDIGIGAGAFVRDRIARDLPVAGYDVMPDSIVWLKHRNLWWDPYMSPMYAATFWDSLEHIERMRRIIGRVVRWCFVSMPIYENSSAVLSSKHFKPGEHIWYFTRWGLIDFMRREGFEMKAADAREVVCGREDIGSFAFERVEWEMYLAEAE